MKNRNRNKTIIALSYGFTSINLFICWLSRLFSPTGNELSLLLFAAVIAIMVPISILEPRQEMCSPVVAYCAIAATFLLNVLMSIFLAIWWVSLLSFIQTTVLLILVFYKKKD